MSDADDALASAVRAAGDAGDPVTAAVRAMGGGPLTEAGLAAHVRPLFARVLAANAQRVYLANHSLGRPLDRVADDVGEGVRLWIERLGDAWGPWLDEMGAHRGRLARLLGAARPDCVVPRTSAGQGLRAVLNTWDAPPRVVATRGEFDSIDVILRHYARRGRIALTLVGPGPDGEYARESLFDAIDGGCDLLVVSHVLFTSGQVLPDLGALVERAHARGARVVLDVYHSLGVLPLDVQALGVDFAIGGSYKYLRGGPGACFLCVHPRWLDGSISTLDIGWFAKRDPFSYQRPDPPAFAAGGDAFLESTPAVLPIYQARAGQQLALALGVERLRAYSLDQQRALREDLARRGVDAAGADEQHGAFLVVTHPRAVEMAARLRERGVVTDARGSSLRLCPDVLTTADELARAAEATAGVVAEFAA